MAKKKQVPSSGAKSLKRWMMVIPTLAALIKLIIVFRIQPIAWPGVDPSLYRLDKYWLGADGENYITGLSGLFSDGLFSEVERLTYFPAGYPILIYLFGFWSQALSLTFAAVLQTLLYGFASGYFVFKLMETRLVRFAFPVALILALNPTLSLSSYAIGYESLVASLLLIVLGLLITDVTKSHDRAISSQVLVAAALFSIMSFTQPRMIATALVVFAVWALATRRKGVAALMMLVTMAITLLLPAALYLRNVVARDVPAISTNLGTTIFIGIGPEATGGYNGKYNGVPCPEAVGTEAEVDSAKVKCAIEWYLNNPVRTVELAAKKATFFWSPWFGPIANGTMARNPWAQNHPLKSTAQTQQGYDFIFGASGKAISWIWQISTLTFLGLGFFVLWRMNGVERLLGIAALAMVVINMFVSMATIGDHRFRLPVAGLSLFLQAVGLTWALSKRKRRGFGSEEKLLWKSFQRTTNLRA